MQSPCDAHGDHLSRRGRGAPLCACLASSGGQGADFEGGKCDGHLIATTSVAPPPVSVSFEVPSQSAPPAELYSFLAIPFIIVAQSPFWLPSPSLKWHP